MGIRTLVPRVTAARSIVDHAGSVQRAIDDAARGGASPYAEDLGGEPDRVRQVQPRHAGPEPRRLPLAA